MTEYTGPRGVPTSTDGARFDTRPYEEIQKEKGIQRFVKNEVAGAERRAEKKLQTHSDYIEDVVAKIKAKAKDLKSLVHELQSKNIELGNEAREAVTMATDLSVVAESLTLSVSQLSKRVETLEKSMKRVKKSLKKGR